MAGDDEISQLFGEEHGRFVAREFIERKRVGQIVGPEIVARRS